VSADNVSGGPAGANPVRGEASFTVGGQAVTLRPTFAALVRAEEELGPLLTLVERAAEGKLSLTEMAGLFWHCLEDKAATPRETLGEAIVETGLASTTPVLRLLLQQILKGR
jgi:hypothetical protein